MLSRLIREFEFPHFAAMDRSTGELAIRYQKLPAIPAMIWPDGTPAMLVEMYLLETAHRYTLRSQDGGSFKVLASSLSHLLRIAYERKCALGELNDSHMKVAVAQLQDELDNRNLRQKKRKSNTIDHILIYWIDFLFWLQKNITTDRVIVGSHDTNPQIPLEMRTYFDQKGRKRVSYYYRYEPAASTPEPKGPIARQQRVKLWDAIQKRSDPSSNSARYLGRFDSSAEMIAELQYLRKRRELVFELLEHTGRRPLEIANLLVSANFSCAQNKRLKISTVKRQRDPDPIDDIPITFQLAQHIEIFIAKHRRELLDRLRRRGLVPKPSDHLLLGNDGNPISPDTLRQELRRLAIFAGIGDERTCMSMFRHRFITNQVKAHLRSFLSDNPDKDRYNFTKSDYRTILHRVAKLTGHGDVESLMVYVDIAWDELGVFDDADRTLTLMSSVDTAISTLSSLLGDLTVSRGGADGSAVDLAIQEIRKLREHIIDAVSIKRSVMAN